MVAKLLQCCLPDNCGNECCGCFFGYESNNSAPFPCGLLISYIYVPTSDGFLYNNTTFIGQNVGPSCPYSPLDGILPASWVPFTTTYTSWWFNPESGNAQILTDKAHDDGLIGSSTNIELYGDYSTNTMIPFFNEETQSTEYRPIENGDIIPFSMVISYYDKPSATYVSRYYTVNDLTYKSYACAQSHLATVTWYDTMQPDGTYWSITNIEATITPS